MISMKARALINPRGSLLLEGVIALFPLTLALALNLEVLLRARRQAVTAWATCAFVRERALGGSRGQSEAEARDKLRRALGAETVTWEETRTAAGLSGRGHWSYAALWKQPGKSHFEVNELCRFPF